MSEEKGLAKGAIGVVESAIMGIAGTAPAYSIAVTTAAIVAAVGVLCGGGFRCWWVSGEFLKLTVGTV